LQEIENKINNKTEVLKKVAFKGWIRVVIFVIDYQIETNDLEVYYYRCLLNNDLLVIVEIAMHHCELKTSKLVCF